MPLTILFVALLVGCTSTSSQPNQDVVLKQIEQQYRHLAAAFDRGDPKAVLAMRTADFHTIGPDGRHLDYNEMEGYTRHWFEVNKPPIKVRFSVREVSIRGDEAVVGVFQEASRNQELAGTLRRVEHSVLQRETWVRTNRGWRVRFVDKVHDQRRWVDGKEVDPSKPFDPDADHFVHHASGND